MHILNNDDHLVTGHLNFSFMFSVRVAGGKERGGGTTISNYRKDTLVSPTVSVATPVITITSDSIQLNCEEQRWVSQPALQEE